MDSKLFFGGKYLYWYLAGIVAINILLLFFPLTNIFGYEFSAVNALLLFILCGNYTISVYKRRVESRTLTESLKVITVGLAQMSFIPLAFALLNTILSGGCSFKDGVLFYIFLTLPSVLGGFSMGLMAIALVNKYRKLLFFAICLMLILIPVFEFYFNPQVYFYTPLLGYFPGVIYDEGLAVNAKIIIYRVLNLIFFSAIIISSLYIINKGWFYKIIFAAGAAAVAVTFFLLSPSMGFSTTKGRLTSELDRKIETNNFTIYFSGKIDDNYVKLITLQHEYYYTELQKFFKVNPGKRIVSFIFNDRSEKKLLFGSENADVAKPWLYQVYVSYDNYNTTLKHELAHIFSGEFGKGLLKLADNLNPSLIEGIAMASEPDYGGNNLNYMAALAYNNGFRTDITRLYDYLNFFKQNSTLSYIYAGSFTSYLIDNYGIDKFKRLYRNLDFQEIYGFQLDEIAGKYYKYLKSFDVSFNKHAADYYFGRKSIFYKVCPRFIAEKVKEGWHLYEQEDYSGAIDIFKQSYALSGEFSSLYGYISSLLEIQEATAAAAFLNSEISKFKGTSSYYNLELKLADVYAEAGQTTKADSLYLEILHQNVGRNFNYIAALRLLLAKDSSIQKMYLRGSDFTKYMILKREYEKRKSYNFIPAMIELSRRLEEDYSLFISQFIMQLTSESYESSFAYYKLSQYMMENLDFKNARKMASLSLRFKEDRTFTDRMLRNNSNIKWLQTNSMSILESANAFPVLP